MAVVLTSAQSPLIKKDQNYKLYVIHYYTLNFNNLGEMVKSNRFLNLPK